MFGPFGFLASKNLYNLAFKYFDFERHLMKVIPGVVHTELYLYVSIIIGILNLIVSDEGYS